MPSKHTERLKLQLPTLQFSKSSQLATGVFCAFGVVGLAQCPRIDVLQDQHLLDIAGSRQGWARVSTAACQVASCSLPVLVQPQKLCQMPSFHTTSPRVKLYNV